MLKRTAANVLLFLALVATLTFQGCASTKRDTTGFAMSNSASVSAGFEDTWQAVKHVLRDGGYELYTRDKRGTFEAYGDTHRMHRVKYTIDLTPVSDKQTDVKIEAVKQVYGVTLLTYPGWHDRKLTEDKGLQAILDAVQAKVAAPAATPAVAEAKPAHS